MTKLQILDQDILSTFMNHDEVRFINYCWWIERGRINKYNLSIYENVGKERLLKIRLIDCKKEFKDKF